MRLAAVLCAVGVGVFAVTRLASSVSASRRRMSSLDSTTERGRDDKTEKDERTELRTAHPASYGAII